MVAYGEFRNSFDKCQTDHRMIFHGMRYFVDKYLARKWTADDLIAADKFYSTHGPNGSKFSYPRDLFQRILHEHDGYFPVKIEALPEGTVIFPVCFASDVSLITVIGVARSGLSSDGHGRFRNVVHVARDDHDNDVVSEHCSDIEPARQGCHIAGIRQERGRVGQALAGEPSS